MDAVDLLRRYAGRERVRWYEDTERVPLDGVVPAAWRAVVIDERGRVERIPYELCVLAALRDAIRRREVWVVGAGRWRDPRATYPPTSRTTATSTTPRSARPWTRRSSSTS